MSQVASMAEPPMVENPQKESKNGIAAFFIVLLILGLIDISIAFFKVPLRWVLPGSILVSLLTVGLPIVALYKASPTKWTVKLGFTFLIGGILAQIFFSFAASKLMTPHSDGGILALVLITISQLCLLTWCLGFGALLTMVIKDRNMILPIAIVLAALDTFLVLTPVGMTHVLLQKHPEIIKTIGYHVNTVSVKITHAPLHPRAFIGPADFLFLGMFFIALYKFKMKTEATFKVIVPVLLAYLLVVTLFGGTAIGPISLGALPALLPIGLVVLLVNIKEWRMTGEEKIITMIIAAVAIGFVAYGFTRKSNSNRQNEIHAREAMTQQQTEIDSSQGSKNTNAQGAINHN